MDSDLNDSLAGLICMAKTHEIRIDRNRSLLDQPATGHNRWHPKIPPVLEVESGDTVIIETRDALDGQITDDSVSDDIRNLNLKRVHPLTGPVFVAGAEPGDILEAHIHEIRTEPFGYTFLLPGSGLLRDYFPDPFLVRWNLTDTVATSRDLPHVRVPAQPFMGVMGVAPSKEMLERTRKNEEQLHEQGRKVLLPSLDSAVPCDETIALNALRTAPPRENAGNLDIRQLVRETKIFFPVLVRGALFSTGDAHFAQGDGETCGTAIETSATLVVSLHVHRGGAVEPRKHPLSFEYATGLDPRNRVARRYRGTIGISTHGDGRIEPGNLTLAAQNALLSMIDLLTEEYGFTREQAYILTSVAVDLRISQIVNLPNVGVSALLPLDILD
jgi:formamidase